MKINIQKYQIYIKEYVHAGAYKIYFIDIFLLTFSKFTKINWQKNHRFFRVVLHSFHYLFE